MRWNRNKRLVVGLVILLLITSIFFLIRSKIFIIKALDVKVEKVACTDIGQIRDSASVLGQNLIFLNSSKIENDLKKQYLCIKDVAISKYFPDKIGLQVFGREPAAILIVLKSEEATKSSVLEEFSKIATLSAEVDTLSLSFLEGPSQSFIVDSEGVVYSKTFEQINAPKIYLGENLTLGQSLDSDLIGNILKILEKIKTFGIGTKEAKIYSKNLLLIGTMPQILFRMDDKIDTQLASLQLILNQAKIDEANLEFIDLRFDKPVVRLAPKK